MSFIAKNPLSIPEIETTPSTPFGTKALFAQKDGWYVLDSTGKKEKIALMSDLANISGDTQIIKIPGILDVSTAFDNYLQAGIYIFIASDLIDETFASLIYVLQVSTYGYGNEIYQTLTDWNGNIKHRCFFASTDEPPYTWTDFDGIISLNNKIKNKADKATTLAGYGIENAYTKTEVDTKHNNLLYQIQATQDIANNAYGVATEVKDDFEVVKSDVEGLQKQILEEAHFRGYVATNAEIQELKATPNDFVYSAESGTVWVYDMVNGWQNTGVLVPDQLTPASETTPLINGVATVGTENAYARGDHRHPTDTTRASVTALNNKADKTEIMYFGSSEGVIPISFHNTEIRFINTPDAISVIFPNDEYPQDFIMGVSFSTNYVVPEISYTNSGIINWVGTDCSLDNGISLFIPSEGMQYDIVIYFNGTQFVGLVNGYEVATGNVVS